MKPSAIFFDLDETLVENRTPVQTLFKTIFDDFSEELKENNKEAFFHHFRLNIAGIWEAMFETDESPESQLTRRFESTIDALPNFGGRDNAELSQRMLNKFVENSSNNVQLHQGVSETLAELSMRGITTGIITNGIERLQLGKIHRLGLHQQVDHVTVSAQARAHKPHSPVFDLALSRANVSAENAWQVGDHATNDVAGAIRVGMSGIFFDPSGQRHIKAFEGLDEQPNHMIRAIPDVLALLS